MPRNAAIEILCGGQKRGAHRPATRGAKHIIWYEKEGHAPLFLYISLLAAPRRTDFVPPSVQFFAACRFHLYARPLREPPAAFICAHARYASCLPPCAALCRAVHSPPVRSAADLLVNVVLVAVGIRLHAHVITLRRAAAAHADADDLFAAHRFALEIENTAFAAFAGSHF